MQNDTLKSLQADLPEDPGNLSMETWEQVRAAAEDAAREIIRLHSLLNSHGINPGSEFICPRCGIRNSPRRNTQDPPF